MNMNKNPNGSSRTASWLLACSLFLTPAALTTVADEHREKEKHRKHPPEQFQKNKEQAHAIRQEGKERFGPGRSEEAMQRFKDPRLRKGERDMRREREEHERMVRRELSRRDPYARSPEREREQVRDRESDRPRERDLEPRWHEEQRHHVRQALEHLRAAGLHEIAEHVEIHVRQIHNEPRVPVLGDIPHIGRLFRQHPEQRRMVPPRPDSRGGTGRMRFGAPQPPQHREILGELHGRFEDLQIQIHELQEQIHALKESREEEDREEEGWEREGDEDHERDHQREREYEEYEDRERERERIE